MNQKKTVRIGIGEGAFEQALHNHGSFNMIVSRQERAFLDRLSRASRASAARTSVLVVQDIDENWS